MNCYILQKNDNYQVVDGNTNKAIATFVNEFDAHRFLQSYLNSVYGVQPPMQRQGLPTYPIPMSSYGIPMMMPQQQSYMQQPLFQPQSYMQQPLPQQVYIQQPLPQQQNYAQQPLLQQQNYAQQQQVQQEQLPHQQNYAQQQPLQGNGQYANNAQQGNAQQGNGQYGNGQQDNNGMIRQQEVNKTKPSIQPSKDESDHGQFSNSTGGYKQYPEGNDSNSGTKKQGTNPFDDTSLTFDMSEFDEDRIGAIIQDNSLSINNTDDDSLGEVALYSKRDKIKEEKRSKLDDESLTNVSFRKEDELYSSNNLESKQEKAQSSVIDDYDLDSMGSVLISESSEQDNWVDSKNINNINDSASNAYIDDDINSGRNEEMDNASITSLYEKDLIPDANIVRRDDGLIDLGPVEEEDDIFSTPRMDSEQDDFENFSLSKNDKKALKKRRKSEEASRKKYSKILK